jgi:carbonic anhydrase/acetyltransferase-like protein (isoleucine patch superfamily)
MIGVLWQPAESSASFAPTVPAGGYPVADESALARAAAALDAVAGEVVLLSGDPDVRVAAESADTVDVVGWNRLEPGGTGLASGHERALVAAASTYVEPDGLSALADRQSAVATRAAEAEAPPDPASTPHVLPTAALASVGSTRELADLLAGRVPERPAVEFDHLYDCRRPWELLAANERALSTLDGAVAGDVHPSAELRGTVVVEAGASVDAGAVVEGPTFVGGGASVGPNSYVRGASYLGPDARVGHGVEVKNSVLFAGAAVPHLTYVGDSVVGPDANVGAGSVVANLRHDGRPVEVTHDGDRLSTGRRKFGAVVGANARLGIGTCVNAGVTLATGSTTTPGETVLRDTEGDAR